MPMNSRSTGAQSVMDPPAGILPIDYSGGNQVLVSTSRGVYISATGNLAVVMVDGSTGTFVGLAAGVSHPMQVRQINQTGSTAVGLVLL